MTAPAPRTIGCREGCRYPINTMSPQGLTACGLCHAADVSEINTRRAQLHIAWSKHADECPDCASALAAWKESK